MTFLWPELLWLLLGVPLVVAAYLYVVGCRKAAAARYASLTLVRDAATAAGGFRHHVPPTLFVLALVAMLVAIARPAAVVSVPSHNETVVLAIDVSGSMRATDVEPHRLAAARSAAKTFIDEQPRGTRIGIVAFAASALVVQHPTDNRDDVFAALDRLQLQRGTALGSAIIAALGAIFPDAGITLETPGGALERRRSPALADPAGGAEKPPFKPVPPGSYGSAAIVLLSDGQRTAGPDALEAARVAADRGVRVYTVGIGTPDGEVMGFEGWRMRVRLDEDTLKGVANVTRGQYFHAGTAADLRKVYASLSSHFVLEQKELEVTAAFAAVGAVLATISAMLSLMWFNRIL